MAEVVKLTKVRKLFHSKNGETEALKNITFSVNENEFVSILGPSGCGKSTVLSIIAGLENSSAGTVELNNQTVGYMLQQDHLFPWLTVKQNALLGLKISRKLNDCNVEFVNSLIEQYDLSLFTDAYPSELSGGMRQRVALIRTLALNPSVLLLDEPFSALDYQTRISVSSDIHDKIKRQKKTAILVTHDISEAIAMSDRIIVFTSRPAEIKAIHKINLKGNPIERRNEKDFSAYFQLLWEEMNSNVIF